MLTTSPLPLWTDLVAALSGPEPDDLELARFWRRSDEAAFWLSGGNWAMRAVVDWWLRSRPSATPSVWLPDFFCNESTLPLRETAARFTFYPLAADLNPRWEECRQLARRASPDLFILVHYFGNPADAATARRFCDDKDALLVEDAAHVLHPASEIGQHADFIFYSPHKPLPVPDGAVLLMRDAASTPAMVDTLSAVGRSAPATWRWLTKRVIQKLPIARRAWQWRAPAAARAPHTYSSLQPTAALSPIARRMLGRVSRRLTAASVARRRNHLKLQELVKGATDLPPALPVQATDAAPFKFVLRCADASSAEQHYRTLRRRGCPVQRWPEKSGWPDLPPEVLADPGRHATAITLQQTLLLLPVHQTMNSAALLSRLSAR